MPTSLANHDIYHIDTTNEYHTITLNGVTQRMAFTAAVGPLNYPMY